MKPNIHGWDGLIAQLAAFFFLRTLPREELEMNLLFIAGFPGTGKSKSMRELCRFLGIDFGSIDVSTIDDVAELAGITDLGANRNNSVAKVIEGVLLQRPVLILDELLRAKGYVQQQLLLLLQGELTLFANPQDMKTDTIIGLGNLNDNMEQGDATPLDSPTANRFAMILDSPSACEMDSADIRALLRNEKSERFAALFSEAFETIKSNYEAASNRWEPEILRFVENMIKVLGKNGPQKSRTLFAIEGRSAKTLMKLCRAALALTDNCPKYDRKETMWKFVSASLSYHRLSGLDLPMQLLKTEFEACYDLSLSEKAIESQIATTLELADKIELMVRNINDVSGLTKSALIGDVMATQDIPLTLACVQLVNSVVWEGQPQEPKAMINRVNLNKLGTPTQAKAEHMILISRMSKTQSMAFGLSQGDLGKMRELLSQVKAHLLAWGVPVPNDFETMPNAEEILAKARARR